MTRSQHERRIGVWIDHAQALVIDLDDDDAAIRCIESEIERAKKTRGGSVVDPAAPMIGGTSHRKLHERRRHALERFYGEVTEALAGADAIALLGPGQAKLEFEKQLPRGLADRICARIRTGRLSEGQLVAKTRECFGDDARRA